MLLRNLTTASLAAVFWAGSVVAGAAVAVPPDAIVISDNGSTNTNGYTIVVTVKGTARFESGDHHGSKRLPAKMLAKLKYDVMMTQPLSHARARPDCMKPVSFGSSLTIALGTEHTADLNCAATPKGETLKSDAEDIATFLDLPTPKHPQP